jgi:DNA-binding NarL/FixJ family response regulator
MIGQAMAKVIRGEVFLPDEPDRVAGLHAGMPAKLSERLSALTQGELRVLELLARGKSNKIIAYELGIKESTVKAHITAILRKLRVHSRTQAVIAARELNVS